ncbi:MAG: hypothetical protein NZ480_05685 [Bdellovibrionaceae bacterium]|nr:hypothetical protein [Pseudobdellovibrionaceae bacterium]MDW8189383.1 hypothetical protein [Pseudobdellovibrionaceae bacterium]
MMNLLSVLSYVLSYARYTLLVGSVATVLSILGINDVMARRPIVGGDTAGGKLTPRTTEGNTGRLKEENNVRDSRAVVPNNLGGMDPQNLRSLLTRVHVIAPGVSTQALAEGRVIDIGGEKVNLQKAVAQLLDRMDRHGQNTKVWIVFLLEVANKIHLDRTHSDYPVVLNLFGIVAEARVFQYDQVTQKHYLDLVDGMVGLMRQGGSTPIQALNSTLVRLHGKNAERIKSRLKTCNRG